MPPTNLSLARQVDAACDRFESAWRSGHTPRIEDFLGRATGPGRAALLRALIAVEVELRKAAGELVAADTYRARFPDDPEAVASALGSAGDTSVSRDSVRTGLLNTPTDAARSTAHAIPPKIGRFSVTALLGEGAFGRVYRATDPQLGREVAIKVPLAAALATPADRERFLREARAAAGLHHPNICPVHEVGEETGHPYIVMGFVPGQSLAAVLKAKKAPLAPKQAALIARKLALALDTAHKKGIVHRDLKPANVMFDKERRDVVVTDFGLARAPRQGDAQATRDGVIMGTPAYMSPEQARGDTKAVGPASDQFALGVVLYEMLTGRRPFTGSVTEVLGKILHVEPDPPESVRPGLDPGLAAVCRKAMAKEPAARYASMRQFADALAPYAADAPPARPATASAETAKAATDTQRIADVFAFTEQAVEKAIRRHRTPTWMKVGLGLLAVLAIVAPTIIFFARTPTVTVMIAVNEDLTDKTLSFLLDGKPMGAEDLARPVELKVGKHVLVVKQNGNEVRRYEFTVSKDDNGDKIKLKGPPGKDRGRPVQQPGPAADPDREAAGWVLGVGGSVAVAAPDRLAPAAIDPTQRLPVNRPDQLPRTPFRLIEVDLTGQIDEANEAGLARLNGLKHLQNLNLMNTRVTDRGLAALDNLPALRALNLHATPVTDAGLKSVARFRSLEWLWLHYLPISDASVAELVGLGQLKNLVLHGTKVTNAALKSVAKLPRLESLLIAQTLVTDDGLADLAGLTELTTLTVSGPEFTGAGLKHLRGLPKLATLELEGAALTDDGLASLPGLTGLTWLQLTPAPNLTDTGLKHLAGMTHLKALRLKSNQITDDGLANLSGLDQVSELRLAGARLTDAGLKHLAPMWRVSALDLSGTGVTGAGLKHLAKLGSLKHLWLADCPVNDAGLAEVAGLKGLEHLVLARTRVTDAGLAPVARLTALKTVDLTDCPVTNDGLARLKKALPGCTIKPETKAQTDRDVAEWALRVGGAVKIYVEETGAAADVGPKDALPAKPFRLVGVNLQNATGLRAEAAARFLAGLKHLEDLRIDIAGDATGRALDFLDGADKLKSLWVNLGARPSKGVLAGIARGCPNLTTLELVGYRPGNGLDELANLKHLRNLFFFYSKFGAPDFEHMQGIRSLDYVHFGKCAESAADAAALRSARPGLTVTRDPPP